MLLENVVFPLDLSIGTYSISSHLVMELLAFFIGGRYYFYLKKRVKQPYEHSLEVTLYLFFGLAAGAFVGSRLLAALVNVDLFFSPPTVMYYLVGKTIVGGLLGGWVGVEITKKYLGITYSTGDLYVFPLIVSIILGRIGCFLHGVTDRTVGVVTSLPWGINQGDNLSRHPTSLYEIFFLIILFITLHYVKNKNLPNGFLFKIFMSSYLLFRFFVEFIKPVESTLFGCTSIQWGALCGVIYYIYFFTRNAYTKGQYNE